MGSAISLTLSEIILQEVEKQAFSFIKNPPVYFGRYIDDCFIVWNDDLEKLYFLLEQFNKVFPSIKLTCEIERNKAIPFLDLIITRGYGNRLYFNIYYKPTSISTPIIASSNHPNTTKTAFFRSRILRARTHTTFSFHEKAEIKKIRTLAYNAGYNKTWIDRLIKNMLEPNKVKITALENNTTIESAPPKYATPIPFSPHFLNIVKYARKKFNVIIPFAQPITTEKLVIKDRQAIKSSGGIYELEFNNPKNGDRKVYVGQTSRLLKKRIDEHKKGSNNVYCGTAVKQFMKTNPDYIPNWDNAKILASPNNHNDLLTRESIEIFVRSEICINGKDGTKIPNIWQPMLTANRNNEVL